MTEPQPQPFSKGEGSANVHAFAWENCHWRMIAVSRIIPRNDPRWVVGIVIDFMVEVKPNDISG
jgi:hypothetical protein